jgi:tetratricopeptide (TPR) repeat protein
LRGLGNELKRDDPAAIVNYREALELWLSLSAESNDVAIILNDIATAEASDGDFPAAKRDYREALRVARAMGDAEGIAIFTGNLSGLALDQEDWPVAEAQAREALPLSEKVGRQELIATNCHRLAKTLVRQGRGAEGLPYAQRALDIYTRLRSPRLEVAQETLEECANMSEA